MPDPISIFSSRQVGRKIANLEKQTKKQRNPAKRSSQKNGEEKFALRLHGDFPTSKALDHHDWASLSFWLAKPLEWKEEEEGKEGIEDL